MNRDVAGRPDPARIEALFDAASDVPAHAQPAFLTDACGSDDALRLAVEELLAAGRAAATSWERSAIEVEAQRQALDIPAAQPGEFFGPYRIIRRIAIGGMSLVYEAMRDDAEFHKRVAIKFIPHGLGDAGSAERFRSERQILAELEHPHIARLLDGGTTDAGIPYLVMEYVDGVPIDEFARVRQLSRHARLALFLDVCEAVEYSHRQLVVHRDLKPGNILVTADGTAKLLDFGIARLLSPDARATRTIQAFTPAYASPEQLQGRGGATATDVYSLGVLLFVLLADRLPYRADPVDTALIVHAICHDPPEWEPPGLIRGDLRSILAQALRKEPERRYTSVEQMAADVRRYLQELPVSARADTWLYRARKFVVRRAVPLAATSAVIVAATVGTISTLAQSRRAERRFVEVRSLAHSLLFDIYDSLLKVPGSLATRQLVADRAEVYLDTLMREVGNDSLLARDLAASYIRLGDVRARPYSANLGDTAGGIDSYRKAQTLLEREVARTPPDDGDLKNLAQVCVNLGRVLVRQSKTTEAMQVLNEAIHVGETLVGRHPRDPAYADLLSRGYAYLGEAGVVSEETSVSRLEQRLLMYRKAIAIQNAAGSSADAGWQQSLSSKYFHVGMVLGELGRLTGDLSYYRQALDAELQGDAINIAQSARDSSPPIRRIVADGRLNVGNTRWLCCRDIDGALRDVGEALTIFREISDADPRNAEGKLDVADALTGRGWLLVQSGRRSAGFVDLRDALAIKDAMARADPNDRYISESAAQTRAVIEELLRHPSF